MKVHTTNYKDTFIEVAADCPSKTGEVPKSKRDKKSVAEMQFDLVSKHPYQYTSDELFFAVFAERNQLAKAEYQMAREQFLSKGQACFRASPLPKRHGFGVHSDSQGKVAIYGRESKEYDRFLNDSNIKKVKAMRNSKM